MFESTGFGVRCCERFIFFLGGISCLFKVPCTLSVSGSFFSQVESLVCLRYLALCLKSRFKPPSLNHLCHLETVKVKSNLNLHLPFMFWNLESLRRLHIDHYCNSCGNDPVGKPPSKPSNLQTLSVPILKGSKKEEQLLRKLPHLRKLRCRLLASWQGKFNRFPKLGFLNRLESIEACHTTEFPCAQPVEFEFPASLKQLILHKFRLEWGCISTIARLPQLESLELFSAFDGKQWDVKEGNFQKLKFLRICESRIKRWNATAESFPKLERLVLAYCRRLQEVPYDFQDINTLQVIEIDQCTSSVAYSVKKIQEDLEELGNEINVCVWDSDFRIGESRLPSWR